ncbi:hypothetical protein J2T15_006078 [Paenibacillus harenae]|uniref:Uncharacterized protein n=2 Tax=Paenibacillus harenae TaxID=306543 RepID=A0ABT9UAC3_PAEHA|nr:hypothetical protein [Paenibacillus harenae]
MDRKEPISFWNRELRIPWQAATLVLLLLVGLPVFGWMKLTAVPETQKAAAKQHRHDREDRLIVMSGGTYYESELREGWGEAR